MSNVLEAFEDQRGPFEDQEQDKKATNEENEETGHWDVFPSKEEPPTTEEKPKTEEGAGHWNVLSGKDEPPTTEGACQP